MRLVTGPILDATGWQEGYVVLNERGQVVERGSKGAHGGIDGEVLHGVVLPGSVDGHTHLGDGVWTREPPRGTLEELVAPPSGLKHRILAGASSESKTDAMRRHLREMRSLGTSLTLDFREEGIAGVEMLRSALEPGSTLPWILGRPSQLEDREEVRQVLQMADGLGLSALKDVETSVARWIANEVNREEKFLALHVSEGVREPIDPVLELKPSLLIHATQASSSDLERIAESRVPVAFCPRSNALYGRFPPLAEAARKGVPILLGTDNAMFNSPDIFREMEFAYLMSRHRGTPITPESLVRAVFITPWEVLGRPEMARLVPGGPAETTVLRLQGEDPYYAVCARGGGATVVPPSL